MIMYIFKVNFMIAYTVKRVEFKIRYNKSRIGIIVRLSFDKSVRISNTSSNTLPAVSPLNYHQLHLNDPQCNIQAQNSHLQFGR